MTGTNMKIENNKFAVVGRPWQRGLLAAGVLAASIGAPQSVWANEEDWLTKDWEVSGYLRQYLSWNLENPTLIGPDGEQRDDYRYDLSMARTVGKLDLYRDFGDWRMKVTGRISRESPTDYGKDLQDVMDEWATTGGAARSSVNLRDDVYDDEELREFWVQGDLTRSTNLKIGRQQVVWGETDFFQLLDVVHGYDFRWRSFLEPENEELRKPLNMVNLTQQFYDLDGSLQLLYIPGQLNDGEDRGSSYDIEGGRWANNPNKGITFASAPFGANVKYNYDHPDADMDDDSFGLRWSGLAGDWGYSLGWFHGPNPNPVVNANPATNPGQPQLQTGPYEGVYEGGATEAGEFIYPYIDVFGITANNYFAGPDLVFSAELAYIPNAPYNVGVESIAEGPGCGFFLAFAESRRRNYSVRCSGLTSSWTSRITLVPAAHPSLLSSCSITGLPTTKKMSNWSISPVSAAKLKSSAASLRRSWRPTTPTTRSTPRWQSVLTSHTEVVLSFRPLRWPMGTTFVFAWKQISSSTRKIRSVRSRDSTTQTCSGISPATINCSPG